jgi:hypothetical protein
LSERASTPGWYPDPDGSGERRWDGERWTEERRGAEGDSDLREHFAVNPLGVPVTALGAVLVVVACFLPAAEVPVAFTEVKANSLIQGMPVEMIFLLLLALAAAGDSYVAARARLRTWRPIVIGGIVVLAAILLASTDNSLLKIYPLNSSGEPITSAESITADPGIGIYVLGIAGALMIAGGVWIRRSERTEVGTESTVSDGETRRCPDCAEEILAAARVCRYCGHKFDSKTRAATS